ncbi:MAG: DNA-deoxyinosine glycosylase [Pseudomonadota bacterium]
MIQSFAPVVPESPTVLVLGSIPGVKSLEHQQYYAHPQNQFWRLMARVLRKRDVPCDYSERLAMLADGGVALWDVLAQCEREGSLDSAIRDEHVNEIGSLLDSTPSIQAVALNGRKAESSFAKHIGSSVSGLAILLLPSSSAANAQLRLDDKAEIWSEQLRPWLGL